MVDKGIQLLDRFATIHRVNCELLAKPVFPMQVSADQEIMSDEDSARLRRPFDELRRVIGQVAGLLLLAEMSGRREIVEVSALMLVEQKLAEAGSQIEHVKARLSNTEVLHVFARVTENVSFCVIALRNAAERRGNIDISEAQRRITVAYRLLQVTADPDRGRSMVDFNQACCSCRSSNNAN